MIKSIYAPLAVLVLTPTLCVAGPIIDVTPDPLDFGDVVVSSTSIVRTLTVTNIGDAVLNVNAMGPHSGSGFDYQEVDPATTCDPVPYDLAPAGSCSLAITFTPPNLGHYTRTFGFTSNGTPDPTSVTLEGTGITDPTKAEVAGNISAQKNAFVVDFISGPPAGLEAGDVVIVDPAQDLAVQTTTTVNHPGVVGVVIPPGGPQGETVQVAVAGVVTIKVIAPVNRGDYLATSNGCNTTTGCAQSMGTSPAPGSFAIALTSTPAGQTGISTVKAIFKKAETF